MSFLESLTTRARARRATPAFPEVSDPRTASAIARLLDEEICSIVAVGEPSGVRESLAAAGADADVVDVFDPGDRHTVESHAEQQVELSEGSVSQSRATQMAEDPLTLAGLLAAHGIADGVVAGAPHPTQDIVRAALRAIGTAQGVDAVSSAFYMLVLAFRGVDDEVLTFADASVIPEPTAEELAGIGTAAAGARRLVVGDEPRVAYLSYSTRGSASGDSGDCVVRALEVFRERLPDVHVDGELQGNAALIDSVGRRKAPGFSVAGRANVPVFPYLNSSNGLPAGRRWGPSFKGFGARTTTCPGELLRTRSSRSRA